MSKESSRLKIDECSEGDVCWLVLKQFSRPLYGEIKRVLENENAIMVMTDMDGFRTAPVENCFWEEIDAKEYRKSIKK